MAIQIPTKSWWETDHYLDESLLPIDLQVPDLWGPQGPAII